MALVTTEQLESCIAQGSLGRREVLVLQAAAFLHNYHVTSPLDRAPDSEFRKDQFQMRLFGDGYGIQHPDSEGQALTHVFSSIEGVKRLAFEEPYRIAQEARAERYVFTQAQLILADVGLAGSDIHQALAGDLDRF